MAENIELKIKWKLALCSGFTEPVDVMLLVGSAATVLPVGRSLGVEGRGGIGTGEEHLIYPFNDSDPDFRKLDS